ncbi:hypothetical protein LIER_11927 [Lithospermum erythrorhizon]|uniref:Uncharacterized protein n=1 Tax=Lithospermum erythrorhizon TaxID=34254 RepID=A0AAV3PRA0_LITER
MKDLCILKYFLSIEVACSQEGIFISQRKHVLDLIFEAGLLGAKLMGFPIKQNQRLAEWANCPLTRRSVYGWIVFLGDSPISLKTNKQVTVSRSSAKAGYRFMATVTCELKWLKGLLRGLGLSHPRPMRLYCDSQSALYLARTHQTFA